MSWFLLVMSRILDFQGRSRRKEYWMGMLFNFLISFAIGFFAGLLKSPALMALSNIFSLMMFIPFLSAGIRRMHDTNHSGWFILVPVYSFYLLVIDGDPGENRFGPNPKAPEPTPSNNPSFQKIS